MVLGNYDLVVDSCGSSWVVIILFQVVLDRFRSFWVVVARFGWFRILVTINHSFVYLHVLIFYNIENQYVKIHE